MNESLSTTLGFQVRSAQTKAHFRDLIDQLTEYDSILLIVAHRDQTDDSSWITAHRAAHLYEAIGMVEYVRDDLRDERHRCGECAEGES